MKQEQQPSNAQSPAKAKRAMAAFALSLAAGAQGTLTHAFTTSLQAKQFA